MKRILEPQDGRLTTLPQRQQLLASLLKLTMLVIVLSSIPDVYFFIWQSVLVVLVTLLILSGVYYLNYKGKTDIAGNVMVFVLSAILFLLSSLLGFNSLVFLFYLPLIIGAPFVVDYKKKYIYYFHISHPVFFIALLFATDFSLFHIDNYSPYQINFIAEFNIIASLFLSHYVVYLILKFSKYSETKFEEIVKDLNEQNVELQKINKELDRFLYSVSHDLRAPLASSLGLVELSKSESDANKLKEYNLLKEQSLRRLDDYVNSLLDFSRNYRVEPIEESIDFKSVIEECVELNRPYGSNFSNLTVNTSVDQKNDFVGDGLRIRIMLNNLLSNAIKYSDPYKEHQVIGIKVFSDSEKVVIQVLDNGIGIDNIHLPNLFDMFYRASERPKGSGLGLYITREVVEKMGGSIKVESSMGTGTCFTVDIPNKMVSGQ